jgi:peptidoglycan/xylan/chitin deacetylase (PgdA/CDA1 family)
MRLRGIGRLRQAAQNLRNRFVSSKALILVYHRVAEVPSDPQLLCVTPEHFAEHLAVLQGDFRPIQLRHLAQTIQDGALPHRSVAVTFDDGYADNLYSAKPLLERHNVPATVFVTAGYIGEQREFWWDELDRLLLQPGTLPDKLHLNANGKMLQWELGSAAHYSHDAYRRYRSWNVLEGDDPSPRQHLYRALCAVLRFLSSQERQKVLDELRVWADTDAMGRLTHRTLSSNELLQLDTGDMIEVGAHTVNHPVLSTLTADGQRAEISRNKQQLQDIIEHQVATFAYPYGSRSDYTAETVAIVQEAGFSCACSNFADVVWRGSDRFQLPRILVRDWDRGAFASRLEGWLRV